MLRKKSSRNLKNGLYNSIKNLVTFLNLFYKVLKNKDNWRRNKYSKLQKKEKNCKGKEKTG